MEPMARSVCTTVQQTVRIHLATSLQLMVHVLMKNANQDSMDITALKVTFTKLCCTFNVNYTGSGTFFLL